MINKEAYVHIGADAAYKDYIADVSFQRDIENVYRNIEYKLKKPDLLGKTLAVSDKQFTQVHKLVTGLSIRLNMTPPAVYVFEDFFYGIESYGMGPFWVEISAKTIRDFDDKELCFLFARELYKIKNQVAYHTMLMNQIFKIYASVPFTGGAMEKISRAKFNHWCRMENFTADNFGYLICGDLSACSRAIVAMVLNSKSMLKEIDIKAFLKQASGINKLDDIVSNFTKSDEALPYAPFRLESLLAYAVSKRGMLARKEIESC